MALIELEAAIATLQEHGVATEFETHLLEHLPTIDAAQVVHGRLISTGYDEMYCEFGNCTVCGADNPMHNKYCRECGARMDGGEEHEAD